MKRPGIIVQWRDIESKARAPAHGGDEAFGFNSPLGSATGLSRLFVSHVRLPPWARSHIPRAVRDEEQFWFVIEGDPDLFVDGNLHRLDEGDGVTLNDRTGIATSFLNNTESDVRLFFMSEGQRYATQVSHALARDSGLNEAMKALDKHWHDAPKRKLGPHPGLTDLMHGGKTRGAAKKAKPVFVCHWRDLLEAKPSMYGGSDEPQGINATFGRRADFSRIGVHVELLKPGRRTSWPHAERDEEEFVFVAEGSVDCWLDGHIHPIFEGDFVGWRGGDGITHAVINNSGNDAVLVVGGEASRHRSRCWYPYHPHRHKEMDENYWKDHPVPKLGPHDGLPDGLRAKLPKAALKNPLAANTAAIRLKRGKEKRR
jgi:uncharacterized cupin superfamily protein